MSKVLLLFLSFLGPLIHVSSQCSITSLTTDVVNCVISPFAEFTINGTVSFTNPPTTGQLTVSNCYGQQQVFNAPFGASVNYTMTQLPQNGSNCNITAVFSEVATCVITSTVVSPSLISSFTTDCTFGSGQVEGTVSFVNPPNGANLVIEISDGTNTISDVIAMPAPSPQNWIVSGLDPSVNPYTITYYFDNHPTCSNSISINCGCSAEGGTVTSALIGDGTNDFFLCENDQININTNNDYAFPNDIGPIGPNALSYQPAYVYLVYSCPPTPNIFPATDPCLLGVVNSTDNLTDVNTQNSFFSQLGGSAAFTNNQVYYAPVTLYHYNPVTPNYTLNSNCWSMGEVTAVTYLPPIIHTETSDCNTNTLTINLSGGYPEINGSNFTASNLFPTSANFINVTCSNGGNIVVENLQNGDNWSFDIVDDNGCPKTITGGPFQGSPTITSIESTDLICNGNCDGEITINAIQGTSYSIDNGVTFSPVNTFSNLCDGIYNIVVDNGSGCVANSTSTLIAPAPLSVVLGTTNQTCFGLCDGSVNAIPSGGSGNYSFSWDLNSAGNTPLISNLCEGQYNLTIIDDNGCELDTFGTVLAGLPPPTISFSADKLSGCSPLLVNFTALDIQPGSSCLWSFGDGSTSTDCNATNHLFNDVGCFDVELTTTTSQGCESNALIPNYICTYDFPIADFYANPSQASVLSPTIEFINTSSEDATKFNWRLDVLNEDLIYNGFELDYDFNGLVGTYLVCLEVKNVNGCADSICKEVSIIDQQVFYVPNAFTPGNDNNNEVFKPIISGISPNNYEFLIFDRWGELLYTSNKIEDSWDGTHKGVDCQQDVYVWKITFKLEKGKVYEHIGHINLIR